MERTIEIENIAKKATSYYRTFNPEKKIDSKLLEVTLIKKMSKEDNEFFNILIAKAIAENLE